MTVERIHAAAGLLAALVVAIFLSSTLAVEALGSREAIARVKKLIVAPGLLVLVPTIAVAGSTGMRLSRGRKGRLVARKRIRMKVIAANGLVILVPAALVLERWAAAGMFDATFSIVQGIELVAGAVNLTLIGLNVRDGLALSGGARTLIAAGTAWSSAGK